MDNIRIQNLTKDFLYESGVEYEEERLCSVISSELIVNKYISGNDLFDEANDDIDLHIFIEDEGTLSDKYKQLIKSIKSKKYKSDSTPIILVFVSSIKKYKEMSRDKVAIEKKKGKYRVLFLGSSEKKQYSIEIKSRLQKVYEEVAEVERIPKKEDNPESKNENTVYGAQGYVYTAYIKSLVELYKDLGDSLFEKNVRVGITSDTRGVGEDIKNTLANNPERFWFLNNGITIVCTEKPNTNKFNQLLLKNDTFSVINGAQTINACQEFFDDDNYKEQHDEAEKKATVVLRVVVSQSNLFAKEVSGALNTQKPIENEDLAYNSSFVIHENEAYQSYNSENREDQRLFRIDRRGEQSQSDYRYSLPQVYRALVASQWTDASEFYPWKALNTANTIVLSVSGNNLDNPLLDIGGIEKEEDIEKIAQRLAYKFQTVNLSMKLFSKYKLLAPSLLEEYKSSLIGDKDMTSSDKIRISNITMAVGRAAWYFVNEFWINYVELKEGDEIRTDCVSWFNSAVTDELIKRMIKLFWSRFEKFDKPIEGQKVRNKEFYSELMNKEVDAIELSVIKNLVKAVLKQ